MLITFLGYLSGILIVISMLPQVIKNYKDHSAKDISFFRSILYVFGVALFVVYGFLINNGPIISMNLIGFCLGTLNLIQKIFYG